MDFPFQEAEKLSFTHEQYPKKARSATGRAGEGKAEPRQRAADAGATLISLSYFPAAG